MYRQTLKIEWPAFGDTVQNLLYAYSTQIESAISKEAKRTANQVRADIQTAAPKRSGTYAKTWTVKTDTKQSHRPTYVVHAKRPGYQLAHLIERPHKIKNQYGEYGYTNGKPHIEPAADKNATQFANNVVKIIKDLS